MVKDEKRKIEWDIDCRCSAGQKVLCTYYNHMINIII